MFRHQPKSRLAVVALRLPQSRLKVKVRLVELQLSHVCLKLKRKPRLVLLAPRLVQFFHLVALRLLRLR